MSMEVILRISQILFIIGSDEYLGQSFILSGNYDGNIAYPEWSIVAGNNYATINSTGKVTILPAAEESTITVQASYNGYTETKDIIVTYDGHQLSIDSANTITGTSGNVIARYDGTVVTPTWSITSGNAYATIDSTGTISIISSGDITVQAEYNDYTTTKNITLVYDAGTTTETEINDDGSTTTTVTIVTENQDGSTTETSVVTTTDENGNTSNTSSETTTNQDGSSTTTSTTTSSDGTSSETTSTTSAPDENGSVTTESTTNTTNADGTSSETTSTLTENEDGSSSSQSETIHYDENGDTTGSTSNETTTNSDGSSNSSTTNYDASGDPTDQQNVDTDTSGNVNTQDVEYDSNGDPVVVGYDIDTTASEGEGKEIEGNGINTEFIPFKFASEGFILHFVFKTIAQDQPRPPITTDTEDGSSNYIYTILGAKTTAQVGNVWPGFEIRWVIPKSNPNYSDTSKVQLQFGRTLSGETSTTRTAFTTGHDENNVYDITITYNPNITNKFIVRNNITNSNIQSVNKTIQNNLDLDLTIGYSTDHNGNEIRHSNVIVYEFNVQKLS